MDTRANLYTKVASFEDREIVWKQAVEFAEKHVKLGQALQAQDLEILKNAQKNDDAEKTAKLIQQATATIEKGIKVEREARDKLIMLYQQQPKDK